MKAYLLVEIEDKREETTEEDMSVWGWDTIMKNGIHNGHKQVSLKALYIYNEEGKKWKLRCKKQYGSY